MTAPVPDETAADPTPAVGAVPSPPAPVNRLPQLDILRTVAILLVLGTHPPVKFQQGESMPWVAVVWHHVGWTGVNLFFVLSGFLIGGLLFAEIRARGSLDVPRFVVRRAFKIWPAYYVYLFILLAIFLKIGAPASDLLPYFFHVQNYAGKIRAIAPHSWSLAVEEHFYLGLPLLLAFMPRPTARVLVPGFVAMAVVCGWLRYASDGGFPEVLTHLCIDSLAFGVLLAFVFHYHRALFERIAGHRLLLVVVGLILVGLAATPGQQPGPWGCALVPVGLFLGYGAILLAMISMPMPIFQIWPMRMLALVGFYSYSIYLFHADIAFQIIYAIDRTAWAQSIPLATRWPVGMLVYVALAIATGILMSRCIEMPALALRDRFFPRKSTAMGEGEKAPGNAPAAE